MSMKILRSISCSLYLVVFCLIYSIVQCRTILNVFFMESKTVVYTPDAGSGSGMMAMLAPLLQQKGIDPNLLMALNSKGNGNGFGGDGSWFLWWW